MAEDEDLEVLASVVSALLATADEETDEGADDGVEEGQHRPIVPGLSEREPGFPTPTRPRRTAWPVPRRTARARASRGRSRRRRPWGGVLSPRRPSNGCRRARSGRGRGFPGRHPLWGPGANRRGVQGGGSRHRGTCAEDATPWLTRRSSCPTGAGSRVRLERFEPRAPQVGPPLRDPAAQLDRPRDVGVVGSRVPHGPRRGSSASKTPHDLNRSRSVRTCDR